MILQNFRLGIFQQHLKSLFKLFNKVIVEVLIAIAMPLVGFIQIQNDTASNKPWFT